MNTREYIFVIKIKHKQNIKAQVEKQKAPLLRGFKFIQDCLALEGRRLQAVALLALMTSLTQHFAVLLFTHPLATLLDDRTHQSLRFLVNTTFNILPLLADRVSKE